jgi:dihydrofolate reductase
MAKLIYFTITSLDGWIAGEGGDYSWSGPDDEVFAFITDLMRPKGAYLYGRRMYSTMAVWQTPELIGPTPPRLEFARIWQAAEKRVYSKSLPAVSTPNTRLEREFGPAAVRALKAQSRGDISIGGPTLAAHAIRASLVDEIQLLVVPALLGGGIRVLPGDVRQTLHLLDQRRFAGGWVYLRYAPAAR